MAELILWWLLMTSIQLLILTLLVAVAVRVCGRLSAEYRYLLYFLIFVKILIPPTWTGSWALGQWGIQPLLEQGSVFYKWENGEGTLSSPISEEEFREKTSNRGTGYVCSALHHEENSSVTMANKLADSGYVLPLMISYFRQPVVLLMIWLTGVAACWIHVLWNYRRVLRHLHGNPYVTRGEFNRTNERLCRYLGIRRKPRLMISKTACFPFVSGIFHATIVLPERMTSIRGNHGGVENALLHELSHLKRHDIQMAWFVALVQSIFWFHPLLWWAGRRLCHWRELACDETALNSKRTSPLDYAQTLLDTLRISRGKTTTTGTSLGILEKNAQLQQRFELIMNYEECPRRFNYRELLILGLFVALIFPMGTFSLSREKKMETGIVQTNILSTPFEFKIIASQQELCERELIETALGQPGDKMIRLNTPTGMESSLIGATWYPISSPQYEQLRRNPDFVFRNVSPETGKVSMEVLLLDFNQDFEIDMSSLTRLEERINPGHRNEILFTLNEQGGEQMARLTEMYIPHDGLSPRRYMAGVRNGMVDFSMAIVDRLGREGSICFEEHSTMK